MSIYDHFTSRLGVAPNDETLRELPIVSECGRACRKVIGAAATMLSAVDDACFDEVRAVAEHAISIYWRG